MKITTKDRGTHLGTLTVEDRGREFDVPVYGRVEPSPEPGEVIVRLSLDPADVHRNVRTKS